MFGRCDVWGWSGHIWETPKHNKALGNIDTIDKCRCGETRTRTVFVPMPDMEPVEEDETPKQPIGIFQFIVFITVLIIGTTFVIPMLESILGGQGTCIPFGNHTRC